MASPSIERKPPRWASYSDERLLDMRFSDLRLSVSTSPQVLESVQRLYGELERRHIRFRPHCWFSQEWFSPDGIPGIAIPFYLAHPRLARLERHFMREVEGGNRNWMMRILRHETGHAIDSAYRLRRRSRWRAIFGPASLPYPKFYRPRPGSRRFVQHLGAWYAQAHPTEDFAETFAVWLKPHSSWRREYVGWPAYAKLEYIDELMHEVGEHRAVVDERAAIEDARQDGRTLRQHYEKKLAYYGARRRSGADELLLKIFTNAPARGAPRASSVLREMRNALRRQLARSGTFSEYLVHQVLRLMIERSDALALHLRGSRRELKPHVVWVLARLAESYEERQLPRVSL